ncbi:hypothetical protein Nepgr_030575 [Nepenthes gracilis]|uniref:non-specific serine/threonine protein kinase n=1 Tax=Nepenthes gracilis TaxID=150966 RepID=A0AAD3TFZ7_NEPGR|nr:hypothetical protein Nepgr_030575 [Nepenthes gracilis]
MAHKGLYPGNCEIVEIEEQEPRICTNRSKPETITEENDRRSLAWNLGRICTLEEDRNQLFEIFNRRSSSRVVGHPHQPDPGPSRKNLSKLAIGSSGSNSPRFGIPEQANLKQALRGLCISQASEMAAMKRLAKSVSPSSEAGRIMALYNHVVIEDATSVLSQDEIAVKSVPPNQNFLPDLPKSKRREKSPKIYDQKPLSSQHMIENGMILPSNEVGVREPLPEISKKEKKAKSIYRDNVRELSKTAAKAAKASSSEALPLTILTNGNKTSMPMRNMLHFIKPAVRTNSSGKKKPKKDPNSGGEELQLGPDRVVCPRCHCVLTDPPFSGKKLNAAAKATNDSGSRSKGEFTRSSKSSPGESSSSTSTSEGSNLSRPSYCDRPHMSTDERWGAIRRIRLQNGKIGLRNFNLLKKLGCGDIGTVYLAELISTNCLFAIKVMDNEFLVRRKKISRAETEKEILRMLDHPFLPTLFCQFTSDNLSCLVMEYCPRGDLHVLRQQQPGHCFSEQAARFYVAEVLLALEYLHMLGVVYRDLKPENILVREDGHIMLSDFDLSLRCTVNPMLLVSPSPIEATDHMPCTDPCTDSICVQPPCQVSCFSPRLLPPATNPQKPKPKPAERQLSPLPLLVAEPTTARSNSFVGTHEYLAPEIIKGEGHGSAVDWWTFGVFLYELLYGRTPFKGLDNDETLANVVLQMLKFPESPVVSFPARDLIAGLLVKEPENRLGTERGAAEIKQHPFFEGMNWALIRCTAPPELPELPEKFGFGKGPPHDKGGKYLGYNNSTGEHLEFEVF